MVLTEFAPDVAGFEREGDLVQQARALLPAVDFKTVDSLRKLPGPAGRFEFVMTFTVLQHMRDVEASAVVQELKRISLRYVLLVEETDPAFADGDLSNEGAGITVGRAIQTYAAWMRPFELELSFPRQVEPDYPRSNVGSFMLFASPAP
jgi:hypothetical protein